MHEDQSEAIAFLMRPESYPHRPKDVTRVDTHGAIIFLAGPLAYKLKRAVRLAYLDFSTLELRKKVCERELELNRVTAPQIYRRLVPVTRHDALGTLVLDGPGAQVDWLIEMNRFDEEALLDRLARRGALDKKIVVALADAVASFHAGAKADAGGGFTESLYEIIVTLEDAFTGEEAKASSVAEPDLAAKVRAGIDSRAPLLAERQAHGFIRRCHGDLHLKNIVLIGDRPVLFDAIEFDERLATIDILYDLAFLLMDLWRRDMRAEANLLFNRYFYRPLPAGALEGLAALPLYLAMRAAVRAMVGIDGLKFLAEDRRGPAIDDIRAYQTLAGALLCPQPARLVAIGGLSGTGKSTIGGGLAPELGAAPGALHLRSDIERKIMANVPFEAHLPKDSYTPRFGAAVYETMLKKAGAALRAGHSVIADATFLDEGERARIEACAKDAGVAFCGLWLQASPEVLFQRIRARAGDASDADAAVLARQLEAGHGPIAWPTIDAGGPERHVLGLVRRTIAVHTND